VKKIDTVRDLSGQRAHMWASRRIEDEVAACRLRALDQVLQRWLPKDAPVLEAGCGLGGWVIHLARLGYDVVGVDNDPSVIERLNASYPDLKVHAADITHLPHDDGFFAAVMSFGVVEHFSAGWGAPLRETWRVLRPGGILVLTVPMNNAFRRIFAHPVRALYLRLHRARGGETHFAEFRYAMREVETGLISWGFLPLVVMTEDFTPKSMSLGIWTDFPPLRSEGLYQMNAAGRAAAWIMNTISRNIASASVLVVAQKPF
jgi:SAM-dependent methyltransferase